MRNLFLVLVQFVILSIYAQNNPTTCIDYEKFDRKLFDSLFLTEINNNRILDNQLPFQYDSVCSKSANYLSRYMISNESYQYNGIMTEEFDGVLLPISNDRFEYFNMISDIPKCRQKRLESESVFGVYIGFNSKTFNYSKLVNFLIQESICKHFSDSIYQKFNQIDIFAGISSEVTKTEIGYMLVVTSVISSK